MVEKYTLDVLRTIAVFIVRIEVRRFITPLLGAPGPSLPFEELRVVKDDECKNGKKIVFISR